MGNYYEQLKHPKWQEMRLRVLEREDFTCQWCERADKTLHVHHTFYKKGAAPWEYPPASLMALCEDCHVLAGDLKERVDHQVGLVAKRQSGLQRVLGYAMALEHHRALEAGIPDGYLEIDDLDVIRGVADYLGLPAVEVLNAAKYIGRDPSHPLGLLSLDLCELLPTPNCPVE